MLIQHKQVSGKGIFYVGQDGAILAELVYSIPAPGKMVIEHTEVDDALRGQKAGTQMMATAVDYARKQGLLIIPVCPFARFIFDTTPEYADVLLYPR